MSSDEIGFTNGTWLVAGSPTRRGPRDKMERLYLDYELNIDIVGVGEPGSYHIWT